MRYRSPLVIILSFLLAVPGIGWAQEPVRINKWPDDVPCDVIHRNPDGSWVQTKSVLRGATIIGGNTLRNTPETVVWDKKCRR